MKLSGKIIRMYPVCNEGGLGMLVIHRKNITDQYPENETEDTPKTSLMRTDLMRAIRN